MSTEPAVEFGPTLRRAREASGRSLRELAEATKLGMRTLEALERDQIERLPPGIFRRSVVRAYAREVGLDAEATLKAFLAVHPDDLPPPGAAIGPVADVPRRPVPWRRLLAIGLVVTLLVLAAACWIVGGGAGRAAELRRRLPVAPATSAHADWTES